MFWKIQWAKYFQSYLDNTECDKLRLGFHGFIIVFCHFALTIPCCFFFPHVLPSSVHLLEMKREQMLFFWALIEVTWSSWACGSMVICINSPEGSVNGGKKWQNESRGCISLWRACLHWPCFAPSHFCSFWALHARAVGRQTATPRLPEKTRLQRRENQQRHAWRHRARSEQKGACRMVAEHRVRWGASRGEQGGAAVGTGSLQPWSSLGLGPHPGGEGGDGSGASGELCK